MPTTTLKLNDDLKARAASVAKMRGVSTHAFLVGAVEQATAAAEKRAVFAADAVRAREDTIESGLAYDADELLAYVRGKARGQDAERPSLKPWPG